MSLSITQLRTIKYQGLIDHQMSGSNAETFWVAVDKWSSHSKGDRDCEVTVRHSWGVRWELWCNVFITVIYVVIWMRAVCCCSTVFTYGYKSCNSRDFFLNWDLLHARLNSHCKAWSYKKKKHKKIKAYRKSL